MFKINDHVKVAIDGTNLPLGSTGTVTHAIQHNGIRYYELDHSGQAYTGEELQAV